MERRENDRFVGVDLGDVRDESRNERVVDRGGIGVDPREPVFEHAFDTGQPARRVGTRWRAEHGDVGSSGDRTNGGAREKDVAHSVGANDERARHNATNTMSTAVARSGATSSARRTSSASVRSFGTRIARHPARRAASTSPSVSPIITHWRGRQRSTVRARRTSAGAGLRQAQASAGPWGQYHHPATGPSISSIRRFTSPTCSWLNRPSAIPLWLVTTPIWIPCARSRDSADARALHRLHLRRITVVRDIDDERAVPVEEHRLDAPSLSHFAGGAMEHRSRRDHDARENHRRDLIEVARTGPYPYGDEMQCQRGPDERGHATGARTPAAESDQCGSTGRERRHVRRQPTPRRPRPCPPLPPVLDAHPCVGRVAALASDRRPPARRTDRVKYGTSAARDLVTGRADAQREIGVLAIRPGEVFVEAADPLQHRAAVREVGGDEGGRFETGDIAFPIRRPAIGGQRHDDATLHAADRGVAIGRVEIVAESLEPRSHRDDVVVEERDPIRVGCAPADVPCRGGAPTAVRGEHLDPVTECLVVYGDGRRPLGAVVDHDDA